MNEIQVSNFERLVLGCMNSYDSNQILILQRFSEIYMIFILLHRSDLKNSAKNRPIFCWKIFVFFAFFDEFCDFSAKF